MFLTLTARAKRCSLKPLLPKQLPAKNLKSNPIIKNIRSVLIIKKGINNNAAPVNNPAKICFTSFFFIYFKCYIRGDVKWRKML